VVRPGEGALLDGHIVAEVHGVDLDMRVGESAEPTSEEPSAGRFARTTHPARRAEHDVVRQDGREPVEIMGVEGPGN
jgi:hypothetical protein